MRVPNSINRISADRLKKLALWKERQEAVDILESQKNRLLRKLARIQKQIGGLLGKAVSKYGRVRRKFSAAARAKMSAAAKARWARGGKAKA